jgi:hypothetical protein
MKRILMVSFAAVFSVGCQGCQTPRPNFDPFLGRTTVPPPATGTVGPPPGIAPDTGGFLQQAPPMNPATGNQFTPPESNNNLYSPPGVQTSPPVGGYPGGYQSSVTPRNSTPSRLAAQAQRDPPPEADPNEPAAVQLAAAEQSWTAANGGTSATQPAAVLPASYTSEIKIITPPAQSAANAPPDQTAASDTAATDIMNLPPKNSSPAAQTPTIMEGRQAYRPVTGGRYGHDPRYTWLKGRLERSQVDGRWKLRYIPIDGATDRYGGSVVLDGSQTADLKPHDFVVVRGQLAAGPQVAGSYAPVYNIEQIEPLDD